VCVGVAHWFGRFTVRTVCAHKFHSFIPSKEQRVREVLAAKRSQELSGWHERGKNEQQERCARTSQSCCKTFGSSLSDEVVVCAGIKGCEGASALTHVNTSVPRTAFVQLWVDSYSVMVMVLPGFSLWETNQDIAPLSLLPVVQPNT
jgi:hypothetical protein